MALGLTVMGISVVLLVIGIVCAFKHFTNFGKDAASNFKPGGFLDRAGGEPKMPKVFSCWFLSAAIFNLLGGLGFVTGLVLLILSAL